MTLKLEYGKMYVNGRGEQRGPMEPHSYPTLNEAGYTFICPKCEYTFTESGVFYLAEPGDSDLVAEYAPPVVETVKISDTLETDESPPCFCPGCISDRLGAQVEAQEAVPRLEVTVTLAREGCLAIMWVTGCSAIVGSLIANFISILLM